MKLSVIHSPKANFDSYYILKCDDINVLIYLLIMNIRVKSRAYYQKELREKLLVRKNAIVDQHAGKEIFFDAYLFDTRYASPYAEAKRSLRNMVRLMAKSPRLKFVPDSIDYKMYIAFLSRENGLSDYKRDLLENYLSKLQSA